MPSTYVPLFLDYKFETSCNHGFIVEVTMKARVLIEDDGKDQWIYGVNPGGIMARGPSSDNLASAIGSFSRILGLVISDLSDVAESFAQFREEMIASFSTNAPYHDFWRQAITAARHGSLDTRDMKRESAEAKPSLVMKQVTGGDDRLGKLVPEATLAEA